MEMAPGGIPLATGGEDRDGLEADVLDVRLGPVLPCWPGGLVLRCTLQGDVIIAADADLLDATGPAEEAHPGPARRLDQVASVLTLAGWDAPAAAARRIRDAVLAGDDPLAGPGLERLRHRVRRSRMLRRSLRGVRPLSEDAVHHLGLPARAAGDTHDRLIGLLDEVIAGAGDGDAGHDPAIRTDRLGDVVTGLDLATARLVLASLGIDGLRVGAGEHEVSHG